MDTEVMNGPPLPSRVRTAFAYLSYVQSRLQPCCHPAGELTKHEEAVERIALRTLVEFMTGECEFADDSPSSNEESECEKKARKRKK
ncbi:MAG: hypothetical protein JNM94_00850 [Phycisphaerae bacterium]|nr:hypothetical protein [Phycisphaerae bacterium]